jgi:predicted house-cleaning noncanonical NTP pyrophosphatase (MazG superfamily)
VFGKCLYTEEDYQKGKNKLKEELKKRYPWMQDKDAEKLADDIIREMTIPEAQKLRDYEENNKQKEVEDLLQDICERSGANCSPQEPKENETCAQGQQ